MLFDQLCGIVERHLPGYRELVESARLFEFPTHPEILRDVDPHDEFMEDHFFLPFRTIATETPGVRVCVLHDMEEDAKGLAPTRVFLEFYPAKPKMRSEYPGAFLLIVGGMKDVSFRTYNPTTTTSECDANHYIYEAYLLTKDRVIDHKSTEREKPTEEVKQEIIRNVISAYVEIMYFNRPDRFVVEVKWNGKRHVSGKKIPRSDERPHYVMLTPNELRTTVGYKPPEVPGLSKAPHERRRHYRTLRSEYWGNSQGKTITVSACWVGPEEFVVGRRIYKVLLNV
jgi:hypothetical protein